MGGTVSQGSNNDDLVDHLILERFIKNDFLEDVFRAVDRAEYYLQGCKDSAYKDMAWKNGLVHLSAPCIYSEVMECLSLKPGMSFLNLGSGTGYLSTMAGLILGPYGTNHGVEIHKELVEYAKIKLQDFLHESGAFDKYEFCFPTFVVGNCLLLDASVQQYDRVYCGASCPPQHQNYMKNLLSVGGILVMPCNDHLMKITRTGQRSFAETSVMPVSFAPLILPTKLDYRKTIRLPEFSPTVLPLQELCRLNIRIGLKNRVQVEHPELLKKKNVFPKKLLKTSVRPPHDENDEQAIASSSRISDTEGSNQDVLSGDSVAENSGHSSEKNSAPRILLDYSVSHPIKQLTDVLEASGVDFRAISKADTECNEMQESDSKSTLSDEDKEHVVLVVEVEHVDSKSTLAGEDKEQHDDSKSTFAGEDKEQHGDSKSTLAGEDKEQHVDLNGDSGIDNISDDSFPEECASDVEMVEVTSSTPGSRCLSGQRQRSSYLKRSAEDIEVQAESDSSRRFAGRVGQACPYSRDSSVIFKRVAFSDAGSEDLDEVDSDSPTESYKPRRSCRLTELSLYSFYLKKKIEQLPLPPPVKRFVNYSRPIH